MRKEVTGAAGLQPDSVSAVYALSGFAEQFKMPHRGESLQVSSTMTSDHAVQLTPDGAAVLIKLA